MGDSDDDLDWDAFENDDVEAVHISANLIEATSQQGSTYVLHEGDPDEGRITWAPPPFAGLNNSNAVATGTHWYREDVEAELWAELDDDGDDETRESQDGSESDHARPTDAQRNEPSDLRGAASQVTGASGVPGGLFQPGAMFAPGGMFAPGSTFQPGTMFAGGAMPGLFFAPKAVPADPAS